MNQNSFIWSAWPQGAREQEPIACDLQEQSYTPSNAQSAKKWHENPANLI